MKINTFYECSRCEKLAAMENMLCEENRHKILRKALKMVCASLGAGTDGESILHSVQSYLTDAYEQLNFAFDWQRKQQADMDSFLFRRFLTWVEQEELLPVKSFVSTEVLLPEGITLSDGSTQLNGVVPIIMKNNKECFRALLIHVTTSSRSMNGKSVWTNASSDLNALVAKYYLERLYPGIEIDVIYLQNSKDTPGKMLSEFDENKTAKSNLHRITYSNLYHKGLFDYDALLTKITEVVTVPSDFSCSECKMEALCKTQSLVEQVNMEEEPSKNYQIPEFTEDQLQVVTHLNGPMRVCAGPGSGKTATLIGRIKKMIEEDDIMPEFMLVVTFTNEAANELRERCLSFLSEDSLPKIATLNGFCYSVLRENAALLEHGLKVLSIIEKLKLIQSIASVMPPLKGFKYGMEYGRNGLYRTISYRLDYYFNCLSEADFFYKYPDCGSDFIAFAEQYQACIEDNGYISFDEQISLCNKLFREHPDVLEIYQSIYQYIMVDEYQDVNQEQVDLLYALASHRNLVVVGDDDQGIYGFRGASADFMIHFENVFPEAKTVVLRDNFRSTHALVTASGHLIKNNENRIDKEIRSKSKGKKNILPVVVRSQSADAISEIIKGLQEEGYQYGDIAILSTKNAPLEEYHTQLTIPTVLAKSYLRNDGFFLLLYCVLKLRYNIHDNRSFYQYLKLHGIEYVQKKDTLSIADSLFSDCSISNLNEIGLLSKDCPYLNVLSKLQTYMDIIDETQDLSDLINLFVIASGWQSSDSPKALFEEIEKHCGNDVYALLIFMEEMIRFEAERRVEVNRSDKVLLSTSHDSKGKEFKVVLLINDYSDAGEETRRLFYVAMTRAKEQLFILQDKNAQVDFLNEIPHCEREVSV